jgi:hypothetical protein
MDLDRVLIADTEPEDFRFEITANPEPDDPSSLYYVRQIALPGAAWHVETVIDEFVTGDPYGLVEAARERQAIPDLEERLAYYAEIGL